MDFFSERRQKSAARNPLPNGLLLQHLANTASCANTTARRDKRCLTVLKRLELKFSIITEKLYTSHKYILIFVTVEFSITESTIEKKLEAFQKAL